MKQLLAIDFKNVKKTYQTTKGRYGLLTDKVSDFLSFKKKKKFLR